MFINYHEFNYRLHIYRIKRHFLNFFLNFFFQKQGFLRILTFFY